MVDTSVWADHFRREEPRLSELLAQAQVVMHPFIAGELALGNLRDWEQAVAMLFALPKAKIASQGELLGMVSAHRLYGTGIGFVDANLLASARLMPGACIWSRDKRLVAHAAALGVEWREPA